MIYLINNNACNVTRCLKKFKTDNLQIKYFTDEEWQEIIISILDHAQTMREFHKQIIFILKDYDAVHIENIDFLKSCPTLQEVTAKIIIELNENFDFYLSGIELEERITLLFDILKEKRINIQHINL